MSPEKTNKKSPNPTDVHVGTRVKLRRVVLGLSQTDVGDALGCTFQQVQKYERGANRISASRLSSIAAFMKVRPEFFFESETGQSPDYGSSTDYVTDFLATAEGLALIRSFQKLETNKLRRSVVALVEELANAGR
jgi:transcriptional regulator with XRE-family HTH domain